MSDEKLDDLVRQIGEAIRFHQQQYENAVRPLVDKLVQIESLRTRPHVVSRDQLDSFAIVPFSPPQQL